MKLFEIEGNTNYQSDDRSGGDSSKSHEGDIRQLAYTVYERRGLRVAQGDAYEQEVRNKVPPDVLAKRDWEFARQVEESPYRTVLEEKINQEIRERRAATNQ